MRDLTESNVTQAVLDKITDDTDPRLREIMTALVQYAHDFIREVNLSSDELLYAARFIQNVGHISDDKREEGMAKKVVLDLAEPFVEYTRFACDRFFASVARSRSCGTRRGSISMARPARGRRASQRTSSCSPGSGGEGEWAVQHCMCSAASNAKILA